MHIDTTLVEFLALALLCAYLIHYYSGPSVSIHIKIWSLLTWVMNFGMALLVPVDLYETLKNSKNPNFENSPRYNNIQLLYLVFYWSVYLLTWTIIPLLQEWENSGDLKSEDRLRRSFKTNAIFYLYLAVGGVIGLIVFFLLDASQGINLPIYLKALATAFGIFLLMLMMGYAMVEIPRSLWLESDNEAYLSYCYKSIREVEI